MNLNTYLNEIDTRLGAVASEQGLHRVLADDEGEFYVFFQRTDENGIVWRSPVCFNISVPEALSGDEPQWDDDTICLCSGKSKVVPVGTNGWVQYVGGWSPSVFTIGDQGDFANWEDAFDAAEERLRTYPPVPDEWDIPGVLNEGEIYQFWPFLLETCSERAIDEVNVGRDDSGFEFYEFEHRGTAFQVLYNLTRNAQLIVNGELCFSVDMYDYVAMQEMLILQLQQLDARPSGR